jgi:glucokinase
MAGALAGAIDLGGTKILAAVVDEDGAIRGQDRRETEAARGQEHVITNMVESIVAACEQAGAAIDALMGIGVAVPGPIDLEAGVLASPPNLQGWKNVPLVRLLEERTGAPVLLENDANAAAVGEHAFGAGRGAQNMIYITISTGIGGGIIADGRIYPGATGAAGEIGHVVVDPAGPRCGCGRYGCLEAFASGTAIAREGKYSAAEDRSPALLELAGRDGTITAEMVAEAARDGDPEAQAIIAVAAHALGLGLVTLVHLFNPELIVIGGGASKIGAPLLEPAEVYMRAHSFPLMAQAVRVVPAATGGTAGILGAAALAFGHGRSVRA